MKITTHVLMGMAFVLISAMSWTTVAKAGMDDEIEKQKEQELEADHETLQIRDLDAERRFAREQALAQEQMEKQSQTRLANLGNQKTQTAERAKTEIALYEQRRKTAEANARVHKADAAKLEEEIKVIENNIAKAQKATESAQAVAAAGQKEVTEAKALKAQLETKNRLTLSAQVAAENEMNHLKQEYKRLSESVKELQGRLQTNTQAMSQKQAMAYRARQNVAALRTKEAELKTIVASRESDRLAEDSQPSVSPAVATSHSIRKASATVKAQ